MTDVAGQVKARAKELTRRGDDARSSVQQAAKQAVPRTETLRGDLTDTFRDAAVEVLKPVMKQATRSAAAYAVTRGPDLVKDRLEQAGGAGALVKGVAARLPRFKREGESPSGTGRGRRLPVQEYVDVGVDLQTAYDQFTQFEDWPNFMHRVERIEQRDDASLMWHENIWGVRRSWEVEITEQQPCERLVWRSKGGPQTIGVVTFHRLSDHLTRIEITMDFQPKGLFEKAASGTRISRRALKSDLMRFKAFIELRDEATGQWRGRIEDGEPVEEETDEQTDDREGDEDEPAPPRPRRRRAAASPRGDAS